MSAPNPYRQVLQDMKTVLIELNERRVPPTPTCFFVWYCYKTNANPELTKAIEDLDEETEINERKLVDLSRHVFGAAPDLINRIGEQTALIMAETSAQISQAADRESEFSRDLEDFDRAISTNDTVGQAQSLISQLAERTKLMQQQTAALEDQLRASSTTITGLQGELERAREEASLDGLTGIANRRTFDYQLGRFAADAVREQAPLSVLMIDIDHFKRFNDTHGHPIGDQLLKVVAKILMSSVKGGDLVARYGGEEFAVLLPRTGLEGACRVGGRIRKAVAGNRVVLRTGRRDLGSVTVSIGVAQFDFREPAAETIARADRGLYQAKAAGRDRVVVGDELEGPPAEMSAPAIEDADLPAA